MRVECMQENLKRALSATARAVAPRATLPILGSILFQTQKGRLRIAATDLEIGVEFFIGAKIEAEGQLALPARLTSDIVLALEGTTVTVSGEQNEAHIVAGNMETKIRGLDPNEFPLIPEMKDGKKFVITASELGSIAENVAYATALDQTRPILTGIYLSVSETQGVAAATDSYRLAEQTFQLKDGPKETISCIIPTRALLEAARILIGGEVTITLGEHQIVFEGEEARLVSRLIEGEFPNYKEIIPTEHSLTATFKAADAGHALRIATLFAKDSANTIVLRVGAPDQLSVHATSAQTGETTATVSANVEGEPLEISFNVKYLTDMIALQKGDVTLLLKSATDPGILKSSSNPTLRYLVMPLKTG